MQKNETVRLVGWFQPWLIGLYCGGMTAVTRSRRAFASSSLSSPLLLLSTAGSSFPLLSLSSSLLIHSDVHLPLSMLYLLRLYSEFRVPAGCAIPKLNTADDSRALPPAASARKKKWWNGTYIYVKETMTPRVCAPFFLSLPSVLLTLRPLPFLCQFHFRAIFQEKHGAA